MGCVRFIHVHKNNNRRSMKRDMYFCELNKPWNTEQFTF